MVPWSVGSVRVVRGAGALAVHAQPLKGSRRLPTTGRQRCHGLGQQAQPLLHLATVPCRSRRAPITSQGRRLTPRSPGWWRRDRSAGWRLSCSRSDRSGRPCVRAGSWRTRRRMLLYPHTVGFSGQVVLDEPRGLVVRQIAEVGTILLNHHEQALSDCVDLLLMGHRPARTWRLRRRSARG